MFKIEAVFNLVPVKRLKAKQTDVDKQTNRPIMRYIEMLAAGAWCEKIDVSKSNAAHWLRVWGEIFKPMVMRHEEQIDELSS